MVNGCEVMMIKYYPMYPLHPIAPPDVLNGRNAYPLTTVTKKKCKFNQPLGFNSMQFIVLFVHGMVFILPAVQVSASPRCRSLALVSGISCSVTTFDWLQDVLFMNV